MNYKKCMKHFNCKTCSDYLYCKDEINAGENKRKKYKKKIVSKKRK